MSAVATSKQCVAALRGFTFVKAEYISARIFRAFHFINGVIEHLQNYALWKTYIIHIVKSEDSKKNLLITFFKELAFRFDCLVLPDSLALLKTAMYFFHFVQPKSIFQYFIIFLRILFEGIQVSNE